MERKKQARLFSILLAGVLLINTIPTPAFAEEIPETPDAVQTEEPAPEESPAAEQESAAVVADEIPVLSEEPAETEETPVLTPEEAPEAEQEEVSNEESDPVSETDEENMTAEEAVSDAATEETAEEVTAEKDSESEAEKEINYPAVTLRETVEGVTVTLSAPEGSLPEGVTMTVEPVHDQAVFAAVDEVLAEEGKSLANAVAFDITLYDTEGNELQPNDFVKVSFSNTDLSAPAEESEISVYRVSDDASEVTPVTTVAANDNNQVFITDHFTIYIAGKGRTTDPNGDGSNQQNSQSHRYYLDFGETIDLASDGDSWIHDVWYIKGVTHGGAITQVGESSTFTNTNVWNSYAAATICHEYGFNPFSYDIYTYEYFFVSLRPQSSFPVTFKFCDVGQTEFTVEDKQYYAVDTIIKPPVHETSKYVDGKLYIFSGWCSDEQCTKVIPSSAFYGVKQNITAYAKYSEASEKYAIVFHGNAPDVTSVPAPQYSSYNVFDNITKEYPERPGYLFGDWAASPDGEPEYSHYNYREITIPEGERVLNLYATWKEREAYVSYDTYDYANRRNWGTRSLSYELLSSISGTAKGSTATPANGYRFVRWIDYNGATVSEEPEFVPQKVGGKYYADATYYAVFEPITHTVTFNTNGGTAIAAQTVNHGAKVTRPSDPTKGNDTCFSFVRWCSDKGLTTEFDFNQAINTDTEIYAQWTSDNHSYDHLESALAPTCTTAGHKEGYMCTKCGKYFTNTTDKIEITDFVIPALGHQWSEVTYEWGDNHSSLTASRTCGRDRSHIETETIQLDTELTEPTRGKIIQRSTNATCTAPKFTTYIGAFVNEDFSSQVVTVQEEPALGHDWEEATITWASDRSSVEAIVHCSRNQGHVKYESVVPAITNTTATCTVAGTITYTATFTKEPFTGEEYADKRVLTDEVEPLGHDWVYQEAAWADDYLSASATRTCNRNGCNETKVVNAVVTTYVTEATCTKGGATTYIATFSPKGTGSTQTKTTNETSALGHDWGEPEYTWSDDNSTVTAVRHCTRNEAHVHALGVQTTLKETTVKPTCETTGIGNYSAEFPWVGYEDQTKEGGIIPALGHDWGEWVIVKEPTTSATGLKERTCKRDPSHKETQVIPVLSPSDKPSDKPSVTPSAAPDLYFIAAGVNGSYAISSYAPLVFTYKRNYDDYATFSHFTGVFVDGQWVDPSRYDAAAGSVIITLHTDYLETLEIGKHTITACFDDGNPVTSDFYITARRTGFIPKTSDDSRMLLWALLELCSLFALLISVHMLRTSD